MNQYTPHQDLAVRPSYGMPPPARGFQQIPPSYPSDRPKPEQPSEDSIGVLEYVRIIRRHRGTVILFAFFGLLAAVLYTMPQTPLFRARAVIEIQNMNSDFLNTRSVNPVSDDTSSNLTDVQTQMKIIQSENLMDRVIAKLRSEGKLGNVQPVSRFAALKRLLNLPGPKKDGDDYGLEQMALRSLAVHQLGQTRVLELLFTSADPKFAADFTNTLTAEYIQTNMEARWQMSETTGEWLTKQLDQMKVKLEKSESSLQQYAERSGLLYTSSASGNNDNKTNISEDKLRQLQEALSTATSERTTAEARYDIAKTAPPESVGDVLNDPTLRQIQEKLTDLKRQEAELMAVYTSKDEHVKKVESQIAPLESAFDAERRAILAHIQNEYNAATRREKLLLDDYKQQSAVVTDQAGKAIQYNILKRAVDSNRQLYESTLQQVEQSSVASAIRASNIRVVDPAKPPRFPFSPSLTGNALVGLVGGTLLGVIFILVKSRADRTLRQPGDVTFWTHAPELGVIPSAKLQGGRRLPSGEEEAVGSLPTAKTNQESVELITWDKKPSMVAEAFRAVLTSILFVGENGSRPKMLVVTSCGPGDGKTTVVSNLGIAMAEIRRRVLIIDADMRRPRMHQLFSLPNDVGLSTLLRDTNSTENPLDFIQETRVPGLFVLSSGPATASAANLLYSQRLPELLARLRNEFDMVLVDTPPSLQLTDARVLARMTDGVVFVARVGQTTVDATVALHKRFWEDHTRILGTVLNDWNPKSAANGYYGASTGYAAYQHRYGG